MIHNVGTLDRTVRIVVGLALLSLLYFIDGNARWWGLIGILPLVTGIVAYCPGYQAMGMDTLENEPAK